MPRFTIQTFGDKNEPLGDYQTDENPTGKRLLNIIEFCLKLAEYDHRKPFSVRVEDENKSGYWLHCGPQAPKVPEVKHDA